MRRAKLLLALAVVVALGSAAVAWADGDVGRAQNLDARARLVDGLEVLDQTWTARADGQWVGSQPGWVNGHDITCSASAHQLNSLDFGIAPVPNSKTVGSTYPLRIVRYTISAGASSGPTSGPPTVGFTDPFLFASSTYGQPARAFRIVARGAEAAPGGGKTAACLSLQVAFIPKSSGRQTAMIDLVDTSFSPEKVLGALTLVGTATGAQATAKPHKAATAKKKLKVPKCKAGQRSTKLHPCKRR
ncbi:MAG: hypothetical protein EPN45_06225 [Rhizobiaceae bacterium]|nr:MAG: hypothetical protein EPN45_06225 [Rhizobiaceae bacterium]